MAQTGFTPIQLYFSSTATNAPIAANLANGELAINITDGKLFYKDNASAVQVIAWKVTPTTAGGTGLTSYTAGDMFYYASGTVLSKLAIGSASTFMTSSGTAPQWASNLTYDGTTMNFSGSAQFITGDFGSATPANRLAFKTNILNGDTRVGIVPNGTGTLGGLALYTDSARATGAFLLIEQRAAETRINSTGFTAGDYKPLNFWSGGAQRLQLTTAGDVSVTTGNVVIATSGKGIDFSATPGTGTSELLADYEEGTWTPILIGGTTNPTVTYTLQRAKYTKVGRVVTVECYLGWSAFTGGSGQLRLDGLPFTVSSTAPNTSSAGALMNMDGITLAAARTFASMQAVGGTTYCVIRNLGSAVGGTTTDIPSTGATGELGFTISYVGV